MRALGRQKKARRKTNDGPNTKTMKKIIGGQISCKTCCKFGHNKRTCIGKTTVDQMIPKWGCLPLFLISIHNF